MLPITSVLFTGCNNKDHNIKDFYKSYQNIATDSQNLILVDANNTYQIDTNGKKININYSLSSNLSTLVESGSTPYYQLKYFYQQLLDDSLSPLYFFGETISNSKKVSDKQTKQLFKQLNTLKQDYADIDYYVGILINSLNSTDNSIVNISHLKKVFVQYEKTIISAGDLSATVCDVYFNTVLSNSNFNYSTKTANELTQADLTRISVDTRARMYYYKSVYANIYNQLYVRGGNLAELITIYPTTTIPTYAPYNYISHITSLNTREDLILNKDAIYNNAVSLYNIQLNFEQSYSYFNTATSKVAYLELDEHSTADEINYGQIITGFACGIAIDSYEIINNLVDLLYY